MHTRKGRLQFSALRGMRICISNSQTFNGSLNQALAILDRKRNGRGLSGHDGAEIPSFISLVLIGSTYEKNEGVLYRLRSKMVVVRN